MQASSPPWPPAATRVTQNSNVAGGKMPHGGGCHPPTPWPQAATRVTQNTDAAAAWAAVGAVILEQVAVWGVAPSAAVHHVVTQLRTPEGALR